MMESSAINGDHERDQRALEIVAAFSSAHLALVRDGASDREPGGEYPGEMSGAGGEEAGADEESA